MSSKETILAFDIDEVIFPFAREYSRWRAEQGLETFKVGALHTYDFAAALGDEEADSIHTSAFIADPGTLAVRPIEGAAEGLLELFERGQLVAITNRYQTQSCGTHAWLERHLPGIFEQVLFARQHPGGACRRKAEICRDIGARLLVDDSPEHLQDLSCAAGILFGQYPWQRQASCGIHARSWGELPSLVSGIISSS